MGFRLWVKRRRWEREMDAELRFHLATQISEYVSQGLSREAAAQRARHEFGALELAKDECRDARGLTLLADAVQDGRYAVRRFISQPGFTAVAVLTLALGIGVNTAVYSSIDAAFFRPLPFAQPEQLARVLQMSVPLDLDEIGPGTSAAEPPRKTGVDIRDLYTMRDVFSQSAAYATGGFNLGTGREPLRVQVTFVTAEFFAMLRDQAARGRVFTREETSPGGPNVTVLSHRLWHTQFGGDPAIVGRSVTLNEARYEVIGVMPEDFRFPAQAQLWLPLPVPAPATIFTAFRNFIPSVVVVRLAPGIRSEVAAERLELMQRAYETRPAAARGTTPPELVIPLQRWLVGDRGTALAVLMASAGLVLLIACANVATLLLSRAAARRREIATHAVLGASRGRILRQLLVESVILAIVGAALGLALAKASLSVLTAVIPPGLAGLAPPQIDWRVLLFTLGVAVSTGVLFGLWPAIGFSREAVGEGLKESGRSTGGHARLTRALVVAQVALACLLVIGAGLMLTSLRSLLTTDVGMRIDLVASARLNLPRGTYKDSTTLATFVESVLGYLGKAPGVTQAAAINTLPLAQEEGIMLRIAAEGREEAGDRRFAPYLVVSPGYFRTMGISLLRGRDLAWTDSRTLPVAVINRAMAHALWPGEDAIGKRFVFVGPARTVVGVVDDARIAELGTAVGPQAYLPIQESPQNYLSLVARGTEGGDISALLTHIATAVRLADPGLPIYAAQPMEAVVGSAVAPRRTNTWLISVFGALALCLASVGVYGVLAYAVVQRTREIGVRMALGAQRKEVLTLVIREGLVLVVFGTVLGLAGAIATTRYLQGMLYGVTPRDPATFVAVTLLFGVVALVASYIPARRATRVDPLTAIRAE